MAGASTLRSRPNGTTSPLREVSLLKVIDVVDKVRAQEDITEVVSPEQLREFKDFTAWGGRDASSSTLKSAVVQKNEQYIALATYVNENRRETDLPLRASQQLVMDVLQTGKVRHEKQKLPRMLEERDFGPLAVTQPGVQLRLATGEGKTLLSAKLGYLFVAGDMPVSCRWMSGTFKELSLAGFLRRVLKGDFVGADPVEESIFEQIARDNRRVVGYTTKDGKDRLMESTVFFGYNTQPVKTFLEDLPDLESMLRSEEDVKKMYASICKFLKDEHKLSIKEMEAEDEEIFVRETMLSGAVAFDDEEGCTRVIPLGAPLYEHVLGRQYIIGRYATSMFDTVIMGKRLYTPFSWLLARTVSLYGGSDKWKSLLSLQGYESYTCDKHSGRAHVVLLAGCWYTLKNTLRKWMNGAHWGKLIRDEADIASDKEKGTERSLKQQVEPSIPMSLHLSGTCDVLSSPQRVARNILGADYPFGYGLGKSVSIERPPSSLPGIFMYEDSLPSQTATDFDSFFSAFSVFNYKIMSRAGRARAEDLPGHQSDQERAYYETWVKYLPFAGTASLSLTGEVAVFKRRFKEAATMSFPEGASARVKEMFHFCNPRGNGLFSGYIVRSGDDETWIDLPEDERPKFKQYLVPIIDLQDQQERWDQTQEEFVTTETVEADLKDGAANLLVVRLKNIRGFNFPLQQFVMALRSSGVDMNPFLQVLGRVTRNYFDTTAIERIYQTRKKQFSSGTDMEQALQCITQHILCGTGLPRRHHAKFLVIRNHDEHIMLAARGLFLSGVSLDDIQSLLQIQRFDTCGECNKPLHAHNTQRLFGRLETSLEDAERPVVFCDSKEPCADITLPEYASCFDDAAGKVWKMSFQNVGVAVRDDESVGARLSNKRRADSLAASPRSPERRRLGPKQPAAEDNMEIEVEPRPSRAAALGPSPDARLGASETRSSPQRDENEAADHAMNVMDDDGDVEIIEIESEAGATSNGELRTIARNSAHPITEGPQQRRGSVDQGAPGRREGGVAEDSEDASHSSDDGNDEDQDHEADRHRAAKRNGEGWDHGDDKNEDGEDDDDDEFEEEDESGNDDESGDDSESEEEVGNGGAGEDELYVPAVSAAGKESGAPPATTPRTRSSNSSTGASESEAVQESKPEQQRLAQDATRTSPGVSDPYVVTRSWPRCKICMKECFFTSDSFADTRPDVTAYDLHKKDQACIEAKSLVDAEGRACGFHIKNFDASQRCRVADIIFPRSSDAKKSVKWPALHCRLCLADQMDVEVFSNLTQLPEHKVARVLARGRHCEDCLQPMMLWYFSRDGEPLPLADNFKGYALVASCEFSRKDDPNKYLRRGYDKESETVVAFGVGPTVTRCTVCQRVRNEKPGGTNVQISVNHNTSDHHTIHRKHVEDRSYRKLVKTMERQKRHCRVGGCVRPRAAREGEPGAFCAEHANRHFWCLKCARALRSRHRAGARAGEAEARGPGDDYCGQCIGPLSDYHTELLSRLRRALFLEGESPTAHLRISVYEQMREAIVEGKLARNNAASSCHFSLICGVQQGPFSVALHRRGDKHSQETDSGEKIFELAGEDFPGREALLRLLQMTCREMGLPLEGSTGSRSEAP